MSRRLVEMALVALSAACGGTPAGGGAGGAPLYSVHFQVEGHNFDPIRGSMRVTATYSANGVGASSEVISVLPWSSSAVADISSGTIVYIFGSFTSPSGCNGATITVSIVANGRRVQSGTFVCGSDFSLREVLP